MTEEKKLEDRRSDEDHTAIVPGLWSTSRRKGAVAPEEPRIATLRLPIDATADSPLAVAVLDPPAENQLKRNADSLAGQAADNA